jgi:site-specific DNA-methyltransferase (adenine-specific)
MVKNIKLYNDDCFNVFPKIKDKSIDLFILDLPYGQTACKWDILIDLDKMWTEIKRTMKPSAVICFFCTTKFGYSIIKSNEKWFKYDLIWKKSRKVGFLSANKRQLRQHENVYVFKEEQGTYHPQKVKGDKVYKDKRNTANNKGYYRKEGDLYTPKQQDNGGFYHPTSIIEHENVYVFNNDNNDDIEIKRNLVLRKYAEKVKEYINKPMKTIDKDIGNQGIHHFYAFNSSQFGLPIEKNYKKLIELYKIDKMEGFLKYEDMIKLEDKTTYNPQKTEGKPYKTKGSDLTNSYYRDNKSNYKSTANDNKGDRHPTSIIENTILEHNNPHKTIHRTEKPVSLLEYLIKTYSNEGDKIMDFTMGSASCGVACMNTKRKFIGVEMDKEIFKLANNRIKEHDKILKNNI